MRRHIYRNIFEWRILYTYLANKWLMSYDVIGNHIKLHKELTKIIIMYRQIHIASVLYMLKVF